MARRIEILLLLSAVSLFAQERRTIELTSITAEIYLPDSIILSESETIFCGEILLSEGEYSLDRLRGILKFDTPPDCETLKISYITIGLDLPLSLRHREPRGAGGSLIDRRPRVNMALIPEGSRLAHSGSIVRGVTIGSRKDAALESAFQLEAFGGIGEDVEITAILSDRDLPIQPEGTSEKISQLDQVLIGVKGPFFEASFGDFNTNLASGEFVGYSRRLSGVQLKGFTDWVSGEVVGAVLEGIWNTYEFNASEGSQGPYQLKVFGKAVQVLAGTETVWLNGEKIKRGLDNDYIIDYNLGQISFTTGRPVGSKDRVVVDFQYTDLDYRRSFFGHAGEVKPLERLVLSYSAMIESDDDDRPLSMELSEADIAALRSAGDEPDSAYVLNAFRSDSGEYILVDSALATEHFLWVGDGDWIVRFQLVGAGNGDYILLSAERYEWVGAGLGSYRPIRKLPLPKSHSVLDVSAQLTLAESLSVSTEIAASSLDENRRSNLSDEDNSGGAYSMKASLKRGIAGEGLGSIGADLKLRHKGEQFSSIGRLDQAEYKRDWGLAGASGDENLLEGSVIYSPLKQVVLNGSYGSNSIGQVRSNRLNYGLAVNHGKLSASANGSSIRTDSPWDRYWGRLKAKIWLINPDLSARFEDKGDVAGFRFYEFTNSLGFSSVNSKIVITPGFDFRRDFDRDSAGISPESEVRTYRVSSELFGWKLNLYHREFVDLTGDGADINTDLGRVEGAIRTPISELRLRYELSKRRSELLEPFYDFVGIGAGNYELDPDRNEYIPMVGGSYLKRFLPTGNFTPSVGSDARANLNLDLSKLKRDNAFLKYLKEFSFDGLFRAEGEFSVASSKAYFLNPLTLLDDKDILSGQFLAEGSLRYGARKPRGITLRRRYNNWRSAQYTTGEETRRSGEYFIEGRANSKGAGNFFLSAKLTNSSRLYPDDSRTGTDISGKGLNFSWNRMMNQRLQAGLNSSYLAEKDAWPERPIESFRYSIGPSGIYFIEGGSLRAEIQYSRVQTEGGAGGLLPYDMAGGDFPGNNGSISLSANINIATGTTLTISYELLSRNKRLPEHTASASVRVIF